MHFQNYNTWLHAQLENTSPEMESFARFIDDPPISWDEVVAICYSPQDGFGIDVFEKFCRDKLNIDENTQDKEILFFANKIMSQDYSCFGDNAQEAQSVSKAAWKELWRSYLVENDLTHFDT